MKQTYYQGYLKGVNITHFLNFKFGNIMTMSLKRIATTLFYSAKLFVLVYLPQKW